MNPPTQFSDSNNRPAMLGDEHTHAHSTSSQAAAAAVASEVASGIEQMSYTDCSRISPEDVQREEGLLPDNFSSPSSPWGKEPPFPLKLHRILSDGKHGSAVVWLSHGRAWRIVDSRALEGAVLPDHFRHSRFASFMRQVNVWGFRRVKSGRDEGAYYHECFLRGLPHVCLKMRRLTGKRPKFGRLFACPDFYAMSEQHPVPDEDGTMPDATFAKPDSETAAAPAPSSSSPGTEQKYQSTCGSSSVSRESPTNGMDFQQCTSMGFGRAGTISNNVGLPQHLLAAAHHQPVGPLPTILLQSPSNQTQDLHANQLVQSLRPVQGTLGAGTLDGGVNNLYGQQVGASLLHHQALSQGGLNMDLTALNLQRLQQLIAQRPIGTTSNIATRSGTPEQEVPPTQSPELLSAFSQLASTRASTTVASSTISTSNCSMAAVATNAASTTHGRDEKAALQVDSKTSSSMTDITGARQAKATDSPRRAFISASKFGETRSRSSSSSGSMHESGSEPSTTNAAQNAAEQEKDGSTTNGGKEKNSKDGSTGGDSTNSSLSVSMSEEGSDSGSHPTESNDGESTDSKDMPSEAGEGGSLLRHHLSRRTRADQTTSSAAMSLVALNESGSDTSSASQGKKSVKSKINKASDRSSALASATNITDTDESSLRKFWDLIPSADESNASGIESDAISAPSSTQSSTDKEVRFANGQQATRPAQKNGTPRSALDVMTLGSPSGTGRAGTAAPTASVTNTSSSGYDSMSINVEAANSCSETSVKAGARTSSLEKELKATEPQKKKRKKPPQKDYARNRRTKKARNKESYNDENVQGSDNDRRLMNTLEQEKVNEGVVGAAASRTVLNSTQQHADDGGDLDDVGVVTQEGKGSNPAASISVTRFGANRESMAQFGESIYKIMSSQADMTSSDLLSSIRDAYEAAEADAKSKGIVGAAIGDDASSDALEEDSGLESDEVSAISTPSSTQSSSGEKKVGFANGRQQTTCPAQQNGTYEGSAREPALGGATVTVTNSSSSGYDSMSTIDKLDSSCSLSSAKTGSSEKEMKATCTRPKKKRKICSD